MTTTEATWAPEEIAPTTFDVAPNLSGLIDVVTDHIDVAAKLVEQRALTFCGFGISKDEFFGSVVDLLLPNRLSYLHGNTPRTNLGDNVYTSTEYPADQSISMHNELSYAHKWPSRLLFICVVPAATGGATSAADAGRWLRALDPEVRAAFADGLTYSQNLHGGRGLGKSWQQTFETDDRAKVEEFLADSDAKWEWIGSGLRVTQTRPATTKHPVTGEEVWFNQVDQWHPAGLPAEIRDFMRETTPDDELPQNATYADGSPIPDAVIEHVMETGWKYAFDMNWRSGDLLLIDNVLTSHARRPYSGKRTVLVSMSG